MTDNENFQLDEASSEPTATAAPTGGGLLGAQRRTIIIAAAIVVVVVAAIIAFAVGGNDSKSSSNGSQAAPANPAAIPNLTPDTLKASVAATGRTVYWAGPETDNTYVLQTLANGQTTVRYVPKGGNADEANAVYRVIGSYPIKGAFDVTKKAAEDPNSTLVTNSDGSIVVYNKSKTTNVYVAFPGVDVQIEIYDPSGQALALATSGRVAKIG